MQKVKLHRISVLHLCAHGATAQQPLWRQQAACRNVSEWFLYICIVVSLHSALNRTGFRRFPRPNPNPNPSAVVFLSLYPCLWSDLIGVFILACDMFCLFWLGSAPVHVFVLVCVVHHFPKLMFEKHVECECFLNERASLISQDGPSLSCCSALHPTSNSDPAGTRMAGRGHPKL